MLTGSMCVQECFFVLTVGPHRIIDVWTVKKLINDVVEPSVVHIRHESEGTENDTVELVCFSSIRAFFTLYEVHPCPARPPMCQHASHRATRCQALATGHVLGSYPISLPHMIHLKAEVKAAPHHIASIKAVGIALKSDGDSLVLKVRDDDESSDEGDEGGGHSSTGVVVS